MLIAVLAFAHHLYCASQHSRPLLEALMNFLPNMMHVTESDTLNQQLSIAWLHFLNQPSCHLLLEEGALKVWLYEYQYSVADF